MLIQTVIIWNLCLVCYFCKSGTTVSKLSSFYFIALVQSENVEEPMFISDFTLCFFSSKWVIPTWPPETEIWSALLWGAPVVALRWASLFNRIETISSCPLKSFFCIFYGFSFNKPCTCSMKGCHFMKVFAIDRKTLLN